MMSLLGSGLRYYHCLGACAAMARLTMAALMNWGRAPMMETRFMCPGLFNECEGSLMVSSSLCAPNDKIISSSVGICSRAFLNQDGQDWNEWPGWVGIILNILHTSRPS